MDNFISKSQLNFLFMQVKMFGKKLLDKYLIILIRINLNLIKHFVIILPI